MSRFLIDRSEHLPGRECSAVTDEPLFEKFGFVIEGNNEADLGRQERTLDYPGT